MNSNVVPLRQPAGRTSRKGRLSTPRRGPARILAALGSAVLPLLLLPSPCEAFTRAGWYPAAGVIWAQPVDSSVSSLYDAGPGLTGAVGYDWPGRFRVEIRLDWFGETGRPAPALAQEAESTIRWMPFALEGHVRLRRGLFTPYVLAGPALVFTEETFRYTLLGSRQEVRGQRTDLGAVAGLGVELTGRRVRGRLSLRAVLTSGDREILRATGRTDEGSGAVSAAFWTLGLEIQPW